ncbi:MAG: hypothetical protein VKI82_11560 [Leptolyngbya sp.]|nr:hypothetical protein [Leptolyngbya sp.]
MANLPNLEPFRSSPSEGAGGATPPEGRRSVSFDLSPRTSSRQPGQRSGEPRRRALGVSLPPGDITLTVGPAAPKRPIFSRHRHDANPALALKVLQDIHLAVESWHGELRQTVQQIQDLYMEGPIVDGWLETMDSSTAQAKDAAALLRHADPQALAGYVDSLYETLGDPDQAASASPDPSSADSPSYRLCSLNTDGQLQCMPCPPEQVSTLSLAIARHQKLRQLVDQKRYLEAKLKRAVEVLTSSRDGLGIVPQVTSDP